MSVAFFVFLLVILVGVEGYLIMILICLHLLINGTEHLFMCLTTINLFFVMYLTTSWAYVLLGCFPFRMNFKSSL